MNDYITLLGSEQVQNAASAMRSAAGTIQQAASGVSGDLERYYRLFEQEVSRAEVLQARREALEALVTEREGMLAENQCRLLYGNSPAYGDELFNELAACIRALKEG